MSWQLIVWFTDDTKFIMWSLSYKNICDELEKIEKENGTRVKSYKIYKSAED